MTDAPTGDLNPRPHAPREVSDDLESIFGGAQGRRAKASRLDLRSLTAKGPRARAGRAATVGAVATAALVGLSAGALMMRPPAGVSLPWRHTSPASAAAAPAPAVTPALLAAATAPPHALRIAPTAPAASPVAPAPAAELAADHPAVATPLQAPRRPSALRASESRLRRAYASAAHAGVSRRTLASYRRRWATLERRQDARPKTTAAAYDRMARDLNRLADGRPVLRQASSHHSYRRRPLLLRILMPWR